MERKIHKIDASGQAVGRIATQIATILRGKHKPEFQPHMDLGDIVELINVDQLKFSGKKLEQKTYFSHSGHVGGVREVKLADMMAKKPSDVITLSVKGMLPKGPLGRSMLKKLHVYAGPEHPHAAQKPEVLEIKY